MGPDYGPGTVANYASGAFKGLSTMLATHPSLMVPAAAVSFAGEMLASECNKIKDDKNQELEIELRTFIEEYNLPKDGSSLPSPGQILPDQCSSPTQCSH